MMPLREQVIEAVEALAPELIETARFLHQNPELAFEERKAKACLVQVLGRHGFFVEEGIGGLETAFLASPRKGSPAIAFLAEYDALPGIGHACGHNLIAAASLGAALALKPLLKDLEGTILLIGCPAEEKGGGKIPLIRAGIFDRLDAALLIHPDNRTIIASRSLAMRRLSVEFFGKAAHAAASPHLGINALDAVILSFVHVNTLRQYLRPDARIHGIITHGGRAANIIPDYAAARFMIRALDRGYLEDLHRKVEECLRGAAWGTGAKLKLTVEGNDYEPLLPNDRLASLFRTHLEELGVPVVDVPEDEGLGSTDVGNVSRVVPAIQPSVAICHPPIACHSQEFAQAAGSEEGERMMLLSAKALALTALDLLTDRGKLAQIRAEFEARRGGER
ncbi:MAG: M20 family metallopeptidase [candidate division NC10 bacterium]|nr:M20 family metallopeptidase [candidate division NC10 bacterium]